MGKRRRIAVLGLAALLLAVAGSPAIATANHVNTAVAWNRIALNIIKDTATNPPVASRALAIVHLSIYEAVNSITRTHEAYNTYLPTSSSASQEAAAITAAYESLITLFPAKQADLVSARDASLAHVPASPAKDQGVAVGKAAAEAITNLRKTDGSTATAAYTPISQPGHWAPVDPTKPNPLLPHWGQVTPFMKVSLKQFWPNAPYSLTSDKYAQDLNEVQHLGSKTSTQRTADQTEIALFWADGAGTYTPPGHWNVVAADLAQAKGLNLNDTARLFALLNIGMADAGVLCWDVKYVYDFWRPIFAIRQADTDNNPATTADTAWEPLIATPPFPEHTSGHSTFSGAASVILSSFFGEATSFTAYSIANPAIKRSYASFTQAAAEAADSRLYGGIHFRNANQEGLASGFEMGKYIMKSLLKAVATPTPIPTPTATPTPTPTATPSPTPTPTMIAVSHRPRVSSTVAPKVAGTVVAQANSAAVPITAKTGAALPAIVLPSIALGLVGLRHALQSLRKLN